MLPILNLIAVDEPMRQSLDLLANPDRWVRIPLACPRVIFHPAKETVPTVLKRFQGILLGREERVVRRSVWSQQRLAGDIGPLMNVPVFWMRDGEAPGDVYWFNMSSDAYDDLRMATPSHKPDELHWFEPEYLPEAEENDARLGRDKFHVYVLGTDRGHYVGHTHDVDRRVRQHQEGRVRSTAGRNPTLLWHSADPYPTRQEAAFQEAILKTCQNHRPEQFRDLVGFDPLPFTYRSHFTEWDSVLWDLFDYPAFIATRPVLEISVLNTRQGYEYDKRVNWICEATRALPSNHKPL